MARDFAEMEREFLGGLKSETGKDLTQWMAAISAAGTTDRNATIDWLKTQGFAFSRASWLERIHSNGGRPVYIDRVEVRAETQVPHSPVAAAPSVRALELRDRPAPHTPPPSQAQRATTPLAPRPTAVRSEAATAKSPVDQASVEAVLSAAKGYRPLCNLVLDHIREVVAGVEVVPVDGYLSLRAPGEFAALAVSSSQLRLGLMLGDRRFDALAQKARLKGPGSQLTHMVVLNDARQVGPALAELIQDANRRING